MRALAEALETATERRCCSGRSSSVAWVRNAKGKMGVVSRRPFILIVLLLVLVIENR